MTQDDWLSCCDPLPMLEFLRASGDRQLRLFAVACSRRVWSSIDDLGRGAVVVAEAFADGVAGRDELRAARLACTTAGGSASWYAAASSAAVAARNAALSAQSGADSSEQAAQADLLRDIIGNPFRTPRLPSITSEVVELARALYDERAFDRLPGLADALVAAGCADAEILDHCRSHGPHVRGCWIVDRVLGKV